jgi:predicted enzyme related to lactoylglutathione lyase
MNPVVHFEMPYHDAKRATAFYAQAFGWNSQDMGEEMDNYLMMFTGNKDARGDAKRGVIDGGLFPFDKDNPMQHPSVVIDVEDIDAAMKRITDAGGTLLGEPMTIPEIGTYISFEDTEGNRNSIIQGAPV